jgi:putative peptidoglycan lipid II flippase
MNERLARSAGVISVATMMSRVLGVARESALAYVFGASATMQMDAFNVAFRVPNLLRDLFAEGAMTAAFVPAFTRTMTERGREAAWRLGSLVINTLLLVTGIVVVLGMIYADPITRAITSAEAFAAQPGKLELTAYLTRIMLPFVTTIAVAVALMGMLNSLRRFFVPALSPAMFNVVTIASAFGLVPLMPMVGLPPITGIAIGTLLGGLGQILVQWPSLHREGFRYQPVLDFRDPDLREILRLLGPGTLGLAAVQINVFVNTYLATTQEQGAVSWLTYAFRLMYLPIGLFGVAIATAAIPDLAKYAAGHDVTALRRTISSGLRMMLMLNVPATIGLIVLADPIVALLLERGEFLPRDTAATAAALMFFAPGLLGSSMVKLASPSFYALRDARTPVIVSASRSPPTWAEPGSRQGHGVSRPGARHGDRVGPQRGPAAVASGPAARGPRRPAHRGGVRQDHDRLPLMGVAAYGASAWLAEALPGRGEIVKLLRVSASIGAGVLVLLLSARMLRIAEFDEALSRVLRRLLPANGPS